MKINLKKEFPLLVIVAIPFIYLGYVWNSLPEKVPMHWNYKGEIDRYGDKQELLLIPLILPFFVYLIFLIVPYIDPKKQIHKMGTKYHTFKFIFVLLMAVLALIIIHSAIDQSISNINYLTLLIGLLFSVIGNFSKTIKPNYFIGIRTPWTLENENVWKTTHFLAGKIWFIGGLLIVCSSLILEKELAQSIFISITLIIAFIPIVYSYFKFKQITKD